MSDFNSSLPIRTEANGDAVIRLVDGTITSQFLAIDAAGLIGTKLSDGAGTAITSQANGSQQALDVGINVAGVQVDPRAIRALTNADVITVEQGTSPWVTNLTQVGGSAIALGQALMAASFPVTIASDQSPLDVAQSGAWVVDQGTSPWVTSVNNLPATVDTNYGAVGASTLRTASQIGNATGAAAFDNGATDAQTLRVAANLAVGGANVSGTNPVPVVLSSNNVGDEINAYNTAAAVAGGATSNHDYTVTALKTLLLSQIEASASGKMKIEVQVETGVATDVWVTKFVQFNSTATPNMTLQLKSPISVAAGVRVRIIRTNKDNQAQDLYSTISGQEV